MNVESSRSHAIFSITVESSEKDEKGDEHVKMGKLQLVDLAVYSYSSVEKKTFAYNNLHAGFRATKQNPGNGNSSQGGN